MVIDCVSLGNGSLLKMIHNLTNINTFRLMRKYAQSIVYVFVSLSPFLKNFCFFFFVCVFLYVVDLFKEIVFVVVNWEWITMNI
jgi:hypothetical protein